MDGKTTGSITSILCERGTLESLKARKRGGETWDSLLRKIEAQYDPTD